MGGNAISIDSTQKRINDLSEERQRLWRLAAKQKLTDRQWERCWREIPQLLTKAWNDHRIELSLERKPRRFARDIAHGDVFSDYLDRAHTDTFGLEYEELSSGYEVRPIPVVIPILDKSATEKPAIEPLKVERDEVLEAFGAELLREVLKEMKKERDVEAELVAAEMNARLAAKRDNLRRWMDETLAMKQSVLDMPL